MTAEYLVALLALAFLAGMMHERYRNKEGQTLE